MKTHKIISSHVWEDWATIQCKNVRRVLELVSGHKVQVELKIYSNDKSKSSARIEVFSPITLQWNHLYSLPYTDIVSVRDFSNFERDIRYLLDRAEQILS